MRRIVMSVCGFAVAWTAVALSGQQPAPGPAPGRGAQAASPPMSFFVTSVGLGKGGDLGGLTGADAHCQTLAAAVGRGAATWRAYLSTQGANAVNARDRIGNGPWYSSTGNQIARNLSHLHGDTLDEARMGNGLNQLHAPNEKGQVLQGRVGGTPANPVVHDVLTGTMPDGRAYTDGVDHTCSNWTSSAEGVGGAQVGHFDRAGLLYCFAAN